MSDQPHLSYEQGQSSGGSGSDSSLRQGRQRARAGEVQAIVHSEVAIANRWGMTCAELERRTGRGHGSVSSALSNLDAAGKIVRLQEERHRQQVYVLPQYVYDRAEAVHHKNLDKRLTDEEAEVVAALREADDEAGTLLWAHECVILLGLINRLRGVRT